MEEVNNEGGIMGIIGKIENEGMMKKRIKKVKREKIDKEIDNWDVKRKKREMVKKLY